MDRDFFRHLPTVPGPAPLESADFYELADLSWRQSPDNAAELRESLHVEGVSQGNELIAFKPFNLTISRESKSAELVVLKTCYYIPISLITNYVARSSK